MDKDYKTKYPKLTYKQMLMLNELAHGHKSYEIGKKYGYAIDEKHKSCSILTKLKKREDAQQYMAEIMDDIHRVRLENAQREENLYHEVQDVLLSNWLTDIQVSLADFITISYYKKQVAKDVYVKQPYIELKKPLDEMPPELVRAIKSIEPDPLGGLKVKLYDRHRSELALANVVGLTKNNDGSNIEDIQSVVDDLLNKGESDD